MTERKRRQSLAKCCSVSLQSWMNQWNCSEVNELAQVLKKNLLVISPEMLYVFDFSWNVVVIVAQSGLKLYMRFHHFSFVKLNPFAQRSHRVPIWSSWRQNFNWLKQVISRQLRNTITVVRNVRIHHPSLLNAKHKTQLFSLSLEVPDRMVKTTLKQRGKRFDSF